MSVKYIVDVKGKLTEVVVPIHLWERMTKKNNGKNMTKSKLAAFAGKITLSIDPLKFQKSIRNEW